MAWLYLPPECVNSSPATAGSGSDSDSPAELSLWCTSSGEHLPRPPSWPGWKTRPWRALLSGTTLRPSTADAGAASWIASLAARPARISPSPESALASLESEAGSGESSSACLRRQGLLFSSGRTSEEQSVPHSTWLRTTLSASATELRHALCALRMSEPLTPVSDSSSWPTPSAKPYGSNQSPSPGAALRPSLQTLSAQWPTPTATDRRASGAAAYPATDRRASGAAAYPATDRRASGAAAYPATDTHNPGTTLTDAAVRLWPTPAARDWKGAPDTEADRGTRGAPDTEADRGTRGAPLNEVAKLWRTPSATDGGGMGGAQDPEKRLAGGHSLRLQDQALTFEPTSSRRAVSPDSGTAGMVLNPEFVEALMGLPPRWSLPVTALSSSATASSHSKRRQRSSSAGSDSSEVADG
jgi:hypothetical protein